jgi:hypothetical protein
VVTNVSEEHTTFSIFAVDVTSVCVYCADYFWGSARAMPPPGRSLGQCCATLYEPPDPRQNHDRTIWENSVLLVPSLSSSKGLLKIRATQNQGWAQVILASIRSWRHGTCLRFHHLRLNNGREAVSWPIERIQHPKVGLQSVSSGTSTEFPWLSYALLFSVSNFAAYHETTLKIRKSIKRQIRYVITIDKASDIY